MEGRDDTKRTRGRDRGIFERPKGSGIWWVRYADENGRIHREKVGTKSLALKVYQKRKTEVQERRFFPERIRRREPSVAEAIDSYLARTENRLSCHGNYVHYASLWKAALPGKTLRQVVPGDIERYANRRVAEVSKATANRELSFLRRVYNVAVADGDVEISPFRAVKLFKENNQRVRYLSDEEETQLKVAMGDEWYMVSFALHTGLRRGEQFNLRWEDLDFVTGIITVRRSKSGEARRIPMNDTVREILRTAPSRLKSRYVFASHTGETPRDAKNFINRVFGPALKTANITNLHWHDLRHTFASRLVMKGVDLRTVQELMGHKSITMTLRYAHLSPHHQLEAVQRLNGPASGTITSTKQTEDECLADDSEQVLEKEEENGAGDRGRTGNVQLGKLAFYH